MRRTLLSGFTAAALVLGAGAAHATGGIMGISGGANLWFHDPEGEILGEDVEGDGIDLDSDRDWNLWFEWDHILPGVPSVRLERTQLEQDGTGSTVVNLDHTDLTLFWSPLPLPMVDIDVGVTARHFDGEVRTPQAQLDPDTSLSGTLPMFFGRVGVDIPGSRIGFEGSLQTLPVGDHSITDFRAHLVYRRWYTGAMLGYREFSVDMDDFSDVTLDVDFSGPYAGAFLRF
ncbi:MAG: TIGR04219 family outer membrane beta-barrel protein [Halorhodospira halophila]|uniref:TIGR04219 family outer membrane beta-barrel protein n=1 Tax=Halorhodospira halophila TaxID=1053 RepID=UPI0026EAD6E8|nr:TIGR04219 family outer membrane beta-barrel protein [Halorhodospira halophila]MCC3750408.1 TIGR04219 family outer membrane beta-barrel protein [Halorhodospira halophila]